MFPIKNFPTTLGVSINRGWCKGLKKSFLNEKIGSIIKELGESKDPDTRKIILIDVPQALSSQSYSRELNRQDPI